jgi:hypothetical protein
MQRRALLLLGVAAAATLGAALLIRPRDVPPPPDDSPRLAFEGLTPRLAQAARIEIVRHDTTLILARSGETWRLPAKDDYPARQERVRELLVGLTELRLTEPRTGNPELFDRLGVEDPTRAGATSSLLRVLDAQGRPLAELVVGRRRVRVQGNVPESAFVRRPAENRAWLAEGRVPLDADPQLWIDRDIANLPRDRIREVSVAREGEAPLMLRRSGDPDGRLGVVEPADPPPLDEINLDEISRAFEFLTFLDVAREAAIPGERLGESRFELTDNLAIRVRVHREEDRVWAVLAAEGDDEAARFNARWRGWAYQVGQWKERAFVPRLDDLKPQAN